MTKLVSLADPTAMRLAHPIRLNVAMLPMYEYFKKNMLGNDWPIVERYLKNPQLTLAEAAYRLAMENHVPHYAAFVGVVSGMPGNTELGGVFGLMSWMRYQLIHYTHFKFDDSLVELLEYTDLEDDIPVSYMLPPYDFNYIELGTSRELSARIDNDKSGMHILEGAYVERATHHDYSDCLQITLTGSPLGHRDASDDATRTVLLSLEDLNKPLSKALEDAFFSHRIQAEKAGLTLSNPESMAVTLSALKLVAKALLYLTLPESRKSLHAEKSALIKQAAGLSSPAKKGKIQRKIAKAYDYVLVQPAADHLQSPSSAVGTGKGPKPHWRRGHYRMQAYGEKHALRRLLFIKRTLVSADGNAPAPKEYRVK